MAATPLTVIGSYLSPYVRKVLVCLELKRLPYRIDPIVPFYGNGTFERLSPLRRVPVLVDGDVVLSDSTVICEYLDERYPAIPLLPADPAARGRARWLEEYADSKLGEAMIWHLFNQLVIRRFVWGEPPDETVLQHAREVEIPQAMDYLESQLPTEGWLFGALGRADVAVAAFFRNAEFARWRVDVQRWPRSAAFVERTLAQPAFEALRAWEDLCTRTPITRHRDALREAGAPVSDTSVANATPQRGLMSI
jgi:glutathione S-transferase